MADNLTAEQRKAQSVGEQNSFRREILEKDSVKIISCCVNNKTLTVKVETAARKNKTLTVKVETVVVKDKSYLDRKENKVDKVETVTCKVKTLVR